MCSYRGLTGQRPLPPLPPPVSACSMGSTFLTDQLHIAWCECNHHIGNAHQYPGRPETSAIRYLRMLSAVVNEWGAHQVEPVGCRGADHDRGNNPCKENQRHTATDDALSTWRPGQGCRVYYGPPPPGLALTVGDYWQCLWRRTAEGWPPRGVQLTSNHDDIAAVVEQPSYPEANELTPLILCIPSGGFRGHFF